MSFPIRSVSLLALCAFLATGCSSVVSTGASEIAGITGAAVAGAVTSNAGVAAGIGLGAQAAARAGIQYAQRRVHEAAQTRIAQAAGPLAVGEVAPWESEHKAPLETGEQGRVTVSRVVAATGLECKEIVFSVDTAVEGAPRSAFYVAMVCRDGESWKWASAEPSTSRWSGLQ